MALLPEDAISDTKIINYTCTCVISTGMLTRVSVRLRAADNSATSTELR